MIGTAWKRLWRSRKGEPCEQLSRTEDGTSWPSASHVEHGEADMSRDSGVECGKGWQICPRMTRSLHENSLCSSYSGEGSRVKLDSPLRQVPLIR
jgi:hypothetical protein